MPRQSQRHFTIAHLQELPGAMGMPPSPLEGSYERGLRIALTVPEGSEPGAEAVVGPASINRSTPRSSTFLTRTATAAFAAAVAIFPATEDSVATRSGCSVIRARA